MVKLKFNIVQKKNSNQKRVRGVKPNKKNIKINTTQKINKKCSNPNAPLTVNSTNLKYNHENRHIILIGIIDLFEKVEKQSKLPEDLIFSTIAFFDKYLEKTERFLNKKEMVSAVYACLDILDKFQNINVFNDPVFKPFYTAKIECEILETVDLEVYPEKLYDHFHKLYNDLTQLYQYNKQTMDFLEEFKKIFLNLTFFLLFHIESQKKTAISNFISCLILSCEKCKRNKSEEAKIIEGCISQLKENNNYSDNDYLLCERLIDESICGFNSLYKDMKSKL